MGLYLSNSEGLKINLVETEEKLVVISHIYNGVPLPLFPEHYITDYPYALILADDNNPVESAYLYLSTVPFTVYVGSSTNNIYATEAGSSIRFTLGPMIGSYRGWTRSVGDGITFQKGEEAYSVSSHNGLNPKWANYLVINDEDGSEYLVATDLVPVYEKQTKLVNRSYKLNLYSIIQTTNGIRPLSSDNYILTDSNGIYLTIKESE